MKTHLFKFVLLLLITVFSSCTQPFDSSNESLQNLTIEIEQTDNRAVVVDELLVTKLYVEITGSVNESFYWYPDTDEDITLSLTPGDYTIHIIHYAEQDDYEITLEESTTFEIKPGYITLIKIIPGMVGEIVIEGSTENNEEIEAELLQRWNAIAEGQTATVDDEFFNEISFVWHSIDQFPHPTFQGGFAEGYSLFYDIVDEFLTTNESFISTNKIMTKKLLYKSEFFEDSWTFEELKQDADSWTGDFN